MRPDEVISVIAWFGIAMIVITTHHAVLVISAPGGFPANQMEK